MKVRRIAAVASAIALQAAPAYGQAVPGNAPGSQTGDTGTAFVGLASSPEANLFTGVAQTSIPIEVPPGRLGLAPNLALAYSSSAGASAYGYGWNLPIPRVHRSTRNGLPRYDDGDEFVLEMPGSVVELERIPGSARGFRAKIESAFLRIGFHDGDNSWTVIDKLGVRFVFGASAAARTGLGASKNLVFSWLLQSIEDPAGNRIDFFYRGGRIAGTSSGLPERVAYGANSRTGMGHFAELRFEWTPLAHAPARVSWRDGFGDPMDHRLSAISTFTHGLAARRYELVHEEDPVSAELRLIGVTLRAFAGGPAGDVQPPSTVFVYSPSSFSGWAAPGAAAADNSFEAPEIGHIRLGRNAITLDNLDVNGDAIVDRVEANNHRDVRLGNGRGFGPRQPWNWPASQRYVRTADGDGNLTSNVFDLDGDSFADFVDATPASCNAPAGTWCVWRGTANGFASAATRWQSPVALLRTTKDGGAKIVSDLVDFDADGRPDLVDASGYDSLVGIGWWKVYRNTGSSFEATARQFPAPVAWLSRSDGPRVSFGLFDINGDSLPDIVSADENDGGGAAEWDRQASWHVYLHEGTRFGASREWPLDGGVGLKPGLSNFLSLHANDGTTIADLFDITGDGRPDFVRRWRLTDPLGPDAVDPCGRRPSRCDLPYAFDSATSDGFCCYDLLVYTNTGSSFAQPVAWSSPAHGLRSDYDTCPDGSCLDETLFDFDFFDFDGDGLVDFIERFTSGGKPLSWLVHPHPASAAGGGVRPNLLLAMRNGIGGETQLRYSAAASMPETRLPFPHWVVTERELVDSIRDDTPLRTSFAYRGGRFDSTEREMRGFAIVQEVDPVGVTRVREYHQDRRRQGRLRKLTVLAPPDCAASPEDPDDPCSPLRFPLGETSYDWPEEGPVLLGAETDVPMHEGAFVENLRRTTTYRYDPYGNVVERRTTSPLATPTTTTSTFVHRVADKPGGVPERYSVSKPVSAMTREDGAARPLVERSFAYDWQAPAAGVMTESATCIEWAAGACARWSRRSFDHDEYGNLVTARSPDGATSRTEYDANRLFAVRTVDPIGLVTRAATEPRHGKVTLTVAPNGNELHSAYDGLGRLLRTWGPGTSASRPLKRYAYWPGSLAAGPTRMLVEDVATVSACTFFDGLGRELGTKREANPAGRRVAVVSGLKRYDSKGLVVAQALPFDSDETELTVLTETFEDAPAWLEFEHDAVGRLTVTRSPDGSTTRVDSSTPGILRTEDANFRSGTHAGSVTFDTFDGLGRRILRESCSTAPDSSAPYQCTAAGLLRRQSWTYDGLGRAVEVRHEGIGAAGDAATSIVRDGLGNRVLVEDSNAGAWGYSYDASGRLVETRKPDGTTIETTYDASGRLLRRRGPGSRTSYRYAMDGGGLGKIARILRRTRSGRTTEQYVYDERGRVSGRYRRVAPRGTTPAELFAAYSYDDFDRRTATQIDGWPTGSDVVYADYDADGNLARITSDAATYLQSAVYDSSGRMLRADYGNGRSDLWEYDLPDNSASRSGHLRCFRTSWTSSAGTGACTSAPGDADARRYTTYDPAGNLVAADDALRLVTDPLHENLRYQYDALGRLETAGFPASRREQFAFDGLGNLTRNGSTILEYGDTLHPSRLTARREKDGSVAAVEYDDNGRRIRDGDREYAYDDSDRLSSVTIAGDPVEEYGYADNGERVLRRDVATGGFEFDLGDGIRLDGGGLERTVFFAGRAIAVERLAATRSPARSARDTDGLPRRLFLHHDHQLSVKTVTGGGGDVLEQHRYRAYGQRRTVLDGGGRRIDPSATRFAFNGRILDAGVELMHFGARSYDPHTGSFLTLDPSRQYPSPYAYSAGNPVAGRDPDGALFELGAYEILILAVGTATFIDSLVSTGDLGHSLTAGIFAGFSVYLSAQMSTVMARPLAQSGHTWLQMTASVASDGFQAIEAVEAIEDGRYAGGIVGAGMLAASLIGIESAGDAGPGTTREEHYERHGIKDRGVVDGKRTIDVNGICATRGGCITNALIAARENLRILFGGTARCVGGCEFVRDAANDALAESGEVLLRCNSFGSIKCLGALSDKRLASNLSMQNEAGRPRLSIEMSGSPLLRPPRHASITYQVNLFDPVVWVGTAYATPLRSDVVLGRNWWVPTPVIVHHSRMYERGFFDALGEILP